MRGMRVGGMCQMCLAQGGVGGECMGLDFTNPVGTGGVLGVFLCLGYCGVGGEWVGGLDQGLEGWDGVMSV